MFTDIHIIKNSIKNDTFQSNVYNFYIYFLINLFIFVFVTYITQGTLSVEHQIKYTLLLLRMLFLQSLYFRYWLNPWT